MNSKTYNGLFVGGCSTYLLFGLVERCCIILHTSSSGPGVDYVPHERGQTSEKAT